MKNITALIGWLLLASGLAIYVYGVVFAIFFPIKIIEHGEIVLKLPDALETITTSVGAILLTNLGAVLGISIVSPNNSLAKIGMAPSTINIPQPISLREGIQAAAVLIYIITLISCGIDWAVHTFKEKPDPVVAIIPQYSKTLIGVISAYIAFVLAINSRN